MSTNFYSLRHRLVLAVAAFSLLVVLLFSFLVIVFAYVVEDRFFERMLADEALHQQTALARTGQAASPKREFIRIYPNATQLPVDLKAQYLAHPQQREFAGEQGRHYHMREIAVADGQTPLLLVAEVSAYLVVRPLREEMLWFLAKTALVVLLLIGSAGYLLARRATAPLSMLAKQVAEAKPDQLPTHFAEHYPNNEIGLLAHSLESALQRIDAFIQREQHFTRDASHELRTPIAIVQSAAELLAAQDLPSSARPALLRIHDAAEQMQQTVTLLLSLAREASAVSATPIALLPLVETSVVQHAALIEGKPVQVIVAVDTQYTVVGDRTVLAIIVDNLIRNAFQYTSKGEIHIQQAGNHLQICDTGIGIEPAVQQRLFEPLSKGEHSSGFGIGLSLISRLCARYDMELTLSNVSNGGTCATLQFGAGTAVNG